jgi:hypothetical protein
MDIKEVKKIAVVIQETSEEVHVAHPFANLKLGGSNRATRTIQINFMYPWRFKSEFGKIAARAGSLTGPTR